MAKREVKTVSAALARTNKASDGLTNLVSGLGTAQDKRSHNFYGGSRVLTRYELESMYRDSWIAQRIIDSVADDMTREWFSMSFDDNSADSRNALERVEKKFSIQAKVNEAIRWGRLYGGAVIIIGIGNDNLSLPLDISKIKPKSLKYLHVMDRWRCSAGPTLTMDLGSPNFGKPDFYMVSESAVTVHWTRVLRFNGKKLPYFLWQQNARWDDSVLQHCFNSISDNDQTTAAIATMVNEANVDVITSDELASNLSTDEGTAQVTDRYSKAAQMKSYVRMLLLDGTEKYEKKSNQFANLDKILEKFMLQVCGAAEIPMTRMYGQSATGMNATGDGDMRNYYDMIKNKQESEERPPMEYLYEIIARSELGGMPDDLDLKFNSLWQTSDKDQATVDYQRAQTDQIYINTGVVTEGAVARELKERGVYPNMTDEEIEMVEALASAPPPVPPTIQAPAAPAAKNVESPAIPATIPVPTPEEQQK